MSVPRAVAETQLSTTAWVVIITGVVVVLLGALIAISILLVRAIRDERRLQADLEQRGVIMAQSRNNAKLTKPHAALRRNTLLPFNATSVWGTFPSVETVEPSSIPSRYASSKPAGLVGRSGLSWPFSARPASARNLYMKKIRVPVLSTVIESPKPSPFVPVLNGSLGGDVPSSRKNQSRPSSDQSLLQYHPAFRNRWQEGDAHVDNVASSQLFRRSLTIRPVAKTEPWVPPNRSRSVEDIPTSIIKPGEMSRLPRPELYARSPSSCSQSPGKAPVAAVPSLPLEIARIKSQNRRRNMRSCSPSRLSVSSLESTSSSILATQSSPVLSCPTDVRVQRVIKRDWSKSVVIGPRLHRDTLTLHRKDQRSQSSIKSSAARIGTITPTSRAESRSSNVSNASSTLSNKMKTAEPVTMSKVPSPTSSPLTVKSVTTPRRNISSHVTAHGSPEQRQKRSYKNHQSMSESYGGPERQLSQASTHASSSRSSNGNPFQWDPAPLLSGKPSALKGSPSARKGNRRLNSVRISLSPTYLGPPNSRSTSPSVMHDIRQDSLNLTTTEKRNSIGLDFFNMPSLSKNQSALVFCPDAEFTAIRASLTPSSPTSSTVGYEHGPDAPPLNFSAAAVLSHLSENGINRLSVGSVFSISAFPGPYHGTDSVHTMASPPPVFAPSRPSNEYGDNPRVSDSSFRPSSPFDFVPPTGTERQLHTDECAPEQPHLAFRNPMGGTAASNFSLPSSTILEVSSAESSRTVTYEQPYAEDSPPCTPKSIPQYTFPSSTPDQSPYKLAIKDTTIPEEYALDTIDPFIISKDAFSMPNGGFDTTTTNSIMSPPDANKYHTTMPSSPGLACSMFEPLLESAFPQSPHAQATAPCSPSLHYAHPDTNAGATPSASSPEPPHTPRSPRPGHASFPTPSLNLTNMPILSPPTTTTTTADPCGKPPSPLRSSMEKPRHMNTTADAQRSERSQQRSPRPRRQISIALPGEEASWLDGTQTQTHDAEATSGIKVKGEEEEKEKEEDPEKRTVSAQAWSLDLVWDDEAKTMLDLTHAHAHAHADKEEEKEKEKEEEEDYLATPTQVPNPKPIHLRTPSPPPPPPPPSHSPNPPLHTSQQQHLLLPHSPPSPMNNCTENLNQTQTQTQKHESESESVDQAARDEDMGDDVVTMSEYVNIKSRRRTKKKTKNIVPTEGKGEGNGKGEGTPSGSLYDEDGFLR